MSCMISAVVLTKNGEKRIKDCLAGLKWCDEIVVIDDDSSDKTVEIASKAGAKVYNHNLNDDFSAQRNFGLELAKGEWILFVDDDEIVNPELAKEITEAVKEKNTSGFYLKRIDSFMNKWLKHGEIGQIRLLRLAKKDAGNWERSVDEYWKIAGETKILNLPLLHYSHPGLTSFLTRINERSSMNAKAFYASGKKITLFEWLKPIAKFVQNYIFNLGFLDGTPGFIFAVLMSLHSFMVRGKLYLLWKRKVYE